MIKNPFFSIIIPLIVLTSCKMYSSHNKHSTRFLEEIETSNKPDYLLADEIKNQLITNGIDTIVLYKRTSIGCCDFYYLLWEEDSKVFVHKFYFDQEKQTRKSIRIEINDEEIFKLIHSQYVDLKTNKVKVNYHFLKKEDDVITIIPCVMSSHYRYSEIIIYGQNDSIYSNRIKDTDFNKYTGVENESGTQLTNDNYEENIRSNWNLLLMAIENKVLSLKETDPKEKEVARRLVN